MSASALEEQIENISKQFLSQFPLKEIDFTNVAGQLNEERQKELINKTVQHSENLKNPVKVSYQKAFLKTVLAKIHEKEIASSEEFCVAYAQLVALPEPESCYRHFEVDEVLISVREMRPFISKGTTGLSTWQAAIALSEWCMANKSEFEGKTVLELGSGTGLTGMVISLLCVPRLIFLTDSHEHVLTNLGENVELNLIQNGSEWKRRDIRLSHTCDVSEFTDMKSTLKINTEQLFWEDVDDEEVKQREAEVIIGADIVFDSALFKAIVRAIVAFLHSPEIKFILACTVRNEETMEEFLTLLGKEKVTVEELPVPEQKYFRWSTESPVRIFAITCTSTS